MMSGIARQPTKVCLDFLARQPSANVVPMTHRASRSALVDVTPSSPGALTPARFSFFTDADSDGKETPVAQTSSKTWTPLQSPFGLQPGGLSFHMGEKHHVRLREAIEASPALSTPSIGIGSRSVSSGVFGSRTSYAELSVKNTFIHVEDGASDSDSEADLPIVQKSKSLPSTRHLLDSASGTNDQDECSPTPSVIAPPARALASIGASLHESGTCKPCAFFWKPGSCQNGAECRHCHECPEDEIRRRKKIKIDGLKLAKKMARESQAAVLAALAGSLSPHAIEA